jgi:hypothetical protein
MGAVDFIKKMLQVKCAKCGSLEVHFRCTRCNRKYCDRCIRVFGEEAARILMERLYGGRGVLTFGSAKIFDDRGRAFCPHCYGGLLNRARATGQWVVQSAEEAEPSCIPL